MGTRMVSIKSPLPLTLPSPPSPSPSSSASSPPFPLFFFLPPLHPVLYFTFQADNSEVFAMFIG